MQLKIWKIWMIQVWVLLPSKSKVSVFVKCKISKYFFLEMFSNEILEISLLNPDEQDKIIEMKTNVEQSEKTLNSSDVNEPQIGIIKLGEESSKVEQNLIKNLMCEICGKKFNKSNQLFVHVRIHTSKFENIVNLTDLSREGNGKY